MLPIVLPPNVAEHFYRGGSRMAELRGFARISEFYPEDWLAATAHRAGMEDIGPSRLDDGRLFADLIKADPRGWLGHDGGPAGRADTGLLVKLLDADQRLPVHVHPDRGFARAHLGTCYGKYEAWYVLSAAGDQAVWAGFTRDITQAELERATEEQDSDFFLANMHRIKVRPGDGIYLPAGTPHAIGSGVFVVETQEPTDFSILLEWSVTSLGREDSHLGLGFPAVYSAVNRAAVTPEVLASWCVHVDPQSVGDRPFRLLPEYADQYFQMELIAPKTAPVAAAQGFAVAIVIDGTGTMTGTDGHLDLAHGQVLAIPDSYGPWQIAGPVHLVVCRPGTQLPEPMS